VESFELGNQLSVSIRDGTFLEYIRKFKKKSTTYGPPSLLCNGHRWLIPQSCSVGAEISPCTSL